MPDPRRKLIAEAMEATPGSSGWDDFVLAKDALPVAVEIIERLDAACSLEAADAEGLREEMADALHTIATQAKEIERLQNFRCACCDGPMYVPDTCAECRDD